ncbi:MAG: molybdate ABC transporter substrate-binding protein [Microthrixaceae bacterium]
MRRIPTMVKHHEPRVIRGAVALAGVVAATVAVGCGDGGNGGHAADREGDVSGEITVSAASSLTGAFTDLSAQFEADHPEVEVRLNFGSSSSLATQVLDGAPVDVFAAADESNMARLAQGDLLSGKAEAAARNELIIVTKPGNPEGITEVGDLADAGVVSLCAADAPCGRYAAEVLDSAGVSLADAQVTRGQNAKATLAAVRDGDAAAGVVYVTDARAAGGAVGTVAISDRHNVVATVPIARLDASPNPAAADAFVAFVLGPAGTTTLAAAGFLPPP